MSKSVGRNSLMAGVSTPAIARPGKVHRSSSVQAIDELQGLHRHRYHLADQVEEG